MRISGAAEATLMIPKVAGTYQVAPRATLLNRLSLPLSCLAAEPMYL